MTPRPDGADLLECQTAHGSIRAARHGCDLLRVVLRGRLLDEDASVPAAWFAATLPKCEHARIFVDLDRLDAYTPAVRRLSLCELLRFSDRWIQVHALVRSRLVAMGIAVANVALGGRVRPYSSRAAFSEAWAAALHGPCGPREFEGLRPR